MPLLKFHLYKGRSEQEVSLLLDAAHQAMVQSFDVPKEDRYQLVSEYRHPFLQALDTGLDIPRTKKLSSSRSFLDRALDRQRSTFTGTFV